MKCPIYFTAGWSAADAELHPEWCIRNRDGSICAPRDMKIKRAFFE